VELEPKVEDPAARTYRATVQYDGTAYYGFQRQRRGVPSVQAELEQALTRLVDHPIRVLGAGRTDTGVHALGQVIGFTIEWPDRHGREALQRALNANLPMDIVVSDLNEVQPGFHPRFDARRRCYEYHILNEPIRQPLWRYRAWHVAQRLDLDRMNEAAALLVGGHDFATFGRPTVGDSTIRDTVWCAVSSDRLKWLAPEDGRLMILRRRWRLANGNARRPLPRPTAFTWYLWNMIIDKDLNIRPPAGGGKR
jgi:tRNA pseudouridine38-40 synthase